MEKMTIAETIRLLCTREKISISALGEKIGKKPANMLNQLKRDDFRMSDIEEMAAALGYRFTWNFEKIENQENT
jgi:hypothetical protein